MVYTPQEKTNEKQDNFHVTGYHAETAENIFQEKQKQENTLSKDYLLEPQMPQFDDQSFYNDNSVYDPNSNLGGSVFGKDPSEKVYDQMQNNKNGKQEEEQNKNFYYAVGLSALAYLFYEFIL